MDVALRILFAAKRIPGTGNYTTSSRIADIFTSLGCIVKLVHYDDMKNDEQVGAVNVEVEEYDCVVALHAIHGYELLMECINKKVTFIIILGGTDVNCCLQSMEKKEQMDFVMQRAGSIVAFNQNMKLKLCGAIPTLSTKIFTIAQSCPILQTIENKSDVRKSYWRQRLGYCSNHFIVLLPASIRSVKAPHFILKDFEQYQNDVNPNARLVIVGPILDEDYVHQQPGVGYIIRQSMEFEQRCTSDDAGTAFAPPLRYLPPISREDLLRLMSDVNVVINTSESEGECGVILEAMTLGIPVVARNNSGNAALISHGSTGWLYDTPKECIDLLADVYTSCLPQEGDNKYVYCDSVKDVCNRAKESALHGHSQEIETTQYRELLCEVKKTHLFTESMN